MSHFDDSPHEMHDTPLTPEAADQLLDGEIVSPEFAELAAMVDDVRTMASSTPTPAVRGALAEFVSLTGNESPAVAPAPAVPTHVDLTAATPRRRKVFAEAMTFAGTMGGKLLIGGSLAAASVTGAQATGLVDVLPSEPTTVVSTDDAPAELPLDDSASLTDETPKPEVVEPAPAEQPKLAEVEPEAIADAVADAEIEEDKAEEDKAEEDKADESETEDKPAEDKPAEEPKVEDKPADDKPKDDTSNDDAIAVLQNQLYADKEAVYTAATDLMAPIKAEKKLLIEALDEVLAPIQQAMTDAKAPLYAELETTVDPERKIEIETQLGVIWNQFVIDRDAAAAAANPAIAELQTQLTNIEIERDAEITRLLEEFQAAVDALG